MSGGLDLEQRYRRVLRLAERASGLGMSAAGGEFRSSRHVPFPLVPAFHDPAVKLADLAAVVNQALEPAHVSVWISQQG